MISSILEEQTDSVCGGRRLTFLGEFTENINSELGLQRRGEISQALSGREDFRQREYHGPRLKVLRE